MALVKAFCWLIWQMHVKIICLMQDSCSVDSYWNAWILPMKYCQTMVNVAQSFFPEPLFFWSSVMEQCSSADYSVPGVVKLVYSSKKLVGHLYQPSWPAEDDDDLLWFACRVWASFVNQNTVDHLHPSFLAWCVRRQSHLWGMFLPK